MYTKKIISFALALILMLAVIPAAAPVMAATGITVKEVVLEREYYYIGGFSEGLAPVAVGDWEKVKIGFIDKTGKEVIPCIYDYVSSFIYGDVQWFSEGLAAVQKNGKWGFIDKTGKEVIPFIYTGVNFGFKKGVAVVRMYGKAGLIDKTGKEIIPCIYDDIYNYNCYILNVYKDGKIGFIDITGKVIAPCVYVYSNGFDDYGLAVVAVGSSYEKAKWGVIDTTGKEVIPVIYDYINGFTEGFTPVKKDGKWSFLDTAGNVTVPFIYDGWPMSFSEGLAAVQKDGKWGFIDTEGNTVIPCIYDDDQYSWRYFFQKGVSFAKKDGKWGLIDKTGKELAPFIYDSIYGFNWDGLDGGLAQVLKYPEYTGDEYAFSLYHNIKYGFIDRTGKEVIPCIYDYVPFTNLYFSDGMAVVGEYFEWYGGTIGHAEYKHGFIDRTGKLIVPYIYDIAGSFSEGFAVVGETSERSGISGGSIAYKYGLIDKTGKEILPIVYDSITGFKDGIAFAQKDGKWSMFKITYPPNGTPIGDILYSNITAYINGEAIPTSVINGKTLVVAEDLLRYGFDVKWDAKERTLKIELNKNKKFDPLPVIKDTTHKPGTFKCKYVYTNIKTYLSGVLVESYAINGVTLIDFELLAKYGSLKWDGKAREIRLTIG